MKLAEILFESIIEQDIYIRISAALDNTIKLLRNFDLLVKVKGYASAERITRDKMTSNIVGNWYIEFIISNDKKLQAIYNKLINARKRLENKLNSGV